MRDILRVLDASLVLVESGEQQRGVAIHREGERRDRQYHGHDVVVHRLAVVGIRHHHACERRGVACERRMIEQCLEQSARLR